MKRVIRQKALLVNASVVRRIVAFLVDLVIVNMVIVTPFGGLLSRIIPTASYQEMYDYLMNSPTNTILISTILAIITVLIMVYFAFFESRIGQTPGKILLNLYVISVEKKTQLGFGKCFLRSVFIIPFFPFSLLWIIDPLYALFYQNNQRLLEVITKTKVVERHILR